MCDTWFECALRMMDSDLMKRKYGVIIEGLFQEKYISETDHASG